MDAVLKFADILQVLCCNDVEFILVGGIAAVLTLQKPASSGIVQAS
jgi:hypothetical protein